VLCRRLILHSDWSLLNLREKRAANYSGSHSYYSCSRKHLYELHLGDNENITIRFLYNSKTSVTKVTSSTGSSNTKHRILFSFFYPKECQNNHFLIRFSTTVTIGFLDPAEKKKGALPSVHEHTIFITINSTKCSDLGHDYMNGRKVTVSLLLLLSTED
jgi:hypothetical protein